MYILQIAYIPRAMQVKDGKTLLKEIYFHFYNKMSYIDLWHRNYLKLSKTTREAEIIIKLS